MKRTAILFCVESNILEKQAKLLIASIRKFVSDVDIIAFSPRLDYLPSQTIENIFSDLGVIHIKENLNTKYLSYPIANKVLAVAYFEQYFPTYSAVIFVDTDTVFINPFQKHLMTDKPALYLRPVDNKGPGSESQDDVNDAFWQQVFKLFNLTVPKATLTTTVRPSTIRPYYNAGFIWVNRIPGFFQQWLQDFLTLVDSDLRPFGYKSRDGDDFRCLDQVALAVTASRYSDYVKILPETYNYPIPFRPFMGNRNRHPEFKDLVHIHYHKWFQHPKFLDHVTNEADKQTEQYRWLKAQLPLHPTINGPFKC